MERETARGREGSEPRSRDGSQSRPQSKMQADDKVPLSPIKRWHRMHHGVLSRRFSKLGTPEFALARHGHVITCGPSKSSKLEVEVLTRPLWWPKLLGASWCFVVFGASSAPATVRCGSGYVGSFAARSFAVGVYTSTVTYDRSKSAETRRLGQRQQFETRRTAQSILNYTQA